MLLRESLVTTYESIQFKKNLYNLSGIVIQIQDRITDEEGAAILKCESSFNYNLACKHRQIENLIQQNFAQAFVQLRKENQALCQGKQEQAILIGVLNKANLNLTKLLMFWTAREKSLEDKEKSLENKEKSSMESSLSAARALESSTNLLNNLETCIRLISPSAREELMEVFAQLTSQQ